MLTISKLQEKLIKAELTRNKNNAVAIGHGHKYIPIILDRTHGQFVRKDDFLIDVDKLKKVKSTYIFFETVALSKELISVTPHKETVTLFGKEMQFNVVDCDFGKFYYYAKLSNYPEGTIYKIENKKTTFVVCL